MLWKRFACTLLAGAVSLGCFYAPAEAASPAKQETQSISTHATSRFNTEVPANTIITANVGFSLEAGETVTIQAVYSPFDASVDFGLIDSDGSFYYFNTKEGNLNETIRIKEKGYYILAVQNNSPNTISVSGYVSY